MTEDHATGRHGLHRAADIPVGCSCSRKGKTLPSTARLCESRSNCRALGERSVLYREQRFHGGVPRGPRGLWFAIVLAVATAASGVAHARGGPVDLAGTWHVLVHYTDDDAADPEQWRWQDRIWVFGRKGSGWVWTEYPIVVFRDDRGRFERRMNGQLARVEHAWSPSESQRMEIQQGLRVNPRAMKRKTLRALAAGGFRAMPTGSAQSASVVTFAEEWSINDLTAPVFERIESLAGRRASSLEGRTRYATERVGDGWLAGSYTRDTSHHGRFRMTRAGGIGGDQTASAVETADRHATPPSVGAAAPDIDAMDHRVLEMGAVLSPSEVERLAVEVAMWSAQGVPATAVESRIAKRVRDLTQGFAPNGAVHDESVRYRFPFAAETLPPRPSESAMTQEGHYVFPLPAGSVILAARAGVVRRIVDRFEVDGTEPLNGRRVNQVVVVHDDGTFATYSELANGVDVTPGQRLDIGEALGRCAAVGLADAGRVSFSVARMQADGVRVPVAVRFVLQASPDSPSGSP